MNKINAAIRHRARVPQASQDAPTTAGTEDNLYMRIKNMQDMQAAKLQTSVESKATAEIICTWTDFSLYMYWYVVYAFDHEVPFDGEFRFNARHRAIV